MKMINDRIHPVFFGLVVAFLAMMVMPTGAWAQDMSSTGLFNTFVRADGDAYTNALLNQIFGPVFEGALGSGSEGGTLFSQVIGWFNAAMLVIAGILFFNNLVTGTVQSAHEGEVMGRNWSSLWAPLRTILAVALLIPLPHIQGYNTAQVFVAFIVKNATNFASATWSLTVRNITTNVLPISAPSASLPQNMVSEMFLLEMCKVILDKQLADSAGAGRPSEYIGRNAEQVTSYNPIDMGWFNYVSPIISTGVGYIGGQTVNTYRTRVTYDLMSTSNNVKQQAACGSYMTPEVPDVIGNRVAAARSDSFSLASTLSNLEDVRSRFQRLHSDILGLPEDGEVSSGLSFDLAGIAQNVHTHYLTNLDASTGTPPDLNIIPDLQAAVRTANERLNQGYSDLAAMIGRTGNRNSAVREAMLNRINTVCDVNANTACLGEGWVGAGAWYMMIARLNAEIASLYAAEGEVSASGSARYTSGNGGLLNRNTGALRQQYDEAYNFGARNFNIAANQMAALGWQISPALVNNIASTFEGGEVTNEFENDVKWNGSGAQAAMNKNITQVISWMNASTFADDPMISLVNVGQAFTSVGTVLILGDLFLPGNVASTIGGIIATAGVTMSIILPLMPFLFWILAVTGYFLLVVEAFFAVNLWAISHLRMDGEGITGGAARDGWLMLLALMVTPFLMVAGYLVGMIIFRISAALITSGMSIALAGILSGGGAIFSIVAMMVIVVFMVIFYMIVIERSFSLVAEFPTKVLRWMGARADLETNGADRVRAGALGAIAATHRVSTGITHNKNLGPIGKNKGTGEVSSG